VPPGSKNNRKALLKPGAKKGFLLSLLFLFVSGQGVSCREKLYYAAGTILPHVTAEMLSPGFWIQKHPFPDELVLTETELSSFNEKLAELSGRGDIFSWSTFFSGENLQKKLSADLDYFQKQTLYTFSGRVDQVFYRNLFQVMSSGELSGTKKIRYGLVVKRADQRFLPTLFPLYSHPGERNIDLLQNNLLEIGTPVVIFHSTVDNGWFYVEGPWTRGWVEAEKVALVSQQELENFRSGKPFVVVVEPLTDVYVDISLTRRYDILGMGARLPVRKSGSSVLEVILPAKCSDGRCQFTSGYLKRRDIHEGFLPYTPRTILEQAFRYLHLPYGWGGMYGMQDCSGFIQSVFATAGVFLPRNSWEQRRVGRKIDFFDRNFGEEEKRKLLTEKAIPGLTLLSMPGHSLLYLGQFNGQPYAIHSLYAYSQPTWHGELLRLVNRVVVSDLGLGVRTRQGTYLSRLVNVTILDGGKFSSEK